ncbi:MAG TPA: RcnB family protein [Phenylobacterium sp.]|nr:RcnB family protein [Phenylobacterium sp.]
MKRTLSVVLALTLLNGSAALAQPNYPNRSDQGDYSSRYGGPRYSRGDRLPDQYRQNLYVVNDWRQRGLRRPAKGYQWVRNDRGDLFLASKTTGMVAQSAYRDEREQQWRQTYSQTYSYNDDVYYKECRNSKDPAGVIIGALIGGLIGNAAGQGGGRTGATVAGVILGGAVGAALTKNLDCDDRSYAYKAYYDGFNSDRVGSRYQWRNPDNNHRGEVRIRNYYNDPRGFRCSNFTQVTTIQGRSQTIQGRACRQPDGTWAVVN